MPPTSKSTSDLKQVTKRQLPKTDNMTSSFLMNQNANYESRIKLTNGISPESRNSNQNNHEQITPAAVLPKKSSKNKEKAISHEEFKGTIFIVVSENNEF